jgi:hypothetical protein
MIRLVPFYKDANIPSEGDELKEMHNMFDYKNALSLMYNTYKKHNPQGIFEVATDLHTKLDFDNVFRSNLDDMNIMQSLTQSNTEYVYKHEGLMVLCGADHLICNNVSNFFHGPNFDIGIFMNGEQVNNTVVLVAKNYDNAKRVDEFFKQRLKIYHKLDEKIKTWYGDQQSYTVLLQEYGLLDMFKRDYSSRYKIYNANGLKVKFFQYGRYVKGLKKGGGLKENPTNILIDFKGPLRKQHFNRLYEDLINR